MKVIAIYSSKGGVGKTAAAVNLAYAAATGGRKVLLCDMDSQGAASFYYRIRPKKKFNRSRLLEGEFEQFIRGTDFAGLDLLPAHFSFRNLDIALKAGPKEKNRLILASLLAPLRQEYEVVIMDCPPNLTLLSENIITAADYVVTPVIPTTLSLLALEQLGKLFKKTSCSRRKLLAFFSMVERRKAMHRQVMEKYGGHSLFLQCHIPYLAEVEKMGVDRRPVGSDGRASRAAEAYRSLWQEIDQRKNVL